jgi:hypothetical protein
MKCYTVQGTVKKFVTNLPFFQGVIKTYQTKTYASPAKASVAVVSFRWHQNLPPDESLQLKQTYQIKCIVPHSSLSGTYNIPGESSVLSEGAGNSVSK